MVFATPAFGKIDALHYGITALLELCSKLPLFRQKGSYLGFTQL